MTSNPQSVDDSSPASDTLTAPSRRLNLLALPSETNARFIILITAAVVIAFQVAIVLITISGYLNVSIQWMIDSFHLRSEPLLDIGSVSDADLLRLAEQLLLIQSNALHAILPALGMVALFLLIFLVGALIIYRSHPQRILDRQKQQPVDVGLEQVPKIHQKVRDLGITSLTGFAVVPREKSAASTGQAFGLHKQHRVLLSTPAEPRKLERLWSLKQEFQVNVLHELGHIATGDVWRTYWSEALWRALLILVMLPALLFALLYVFALDIRLNPGPVLLRLLQVSGLFVFIWLIRASLMRTREFYADWWAVTRPGDESAALQARLIGELQRDKQPDSSHTTSATTLAEALRRSLQQVITTPGLRSPIICVLFIVVITVILSRMLSVEAPVVQPGLPDQLPIVGLPWAGFLILVVVLPVLFVFIAPLQIIYDRWGAGITSALKSFIARISRPHPISHDDSRAAPEHAPGRWWMRLGPWLSFHPPAQKRKETLSDPAWLFALSADLSFLTGLLLAMLLFALLQVVLFLGIPVTQLSEIAIWTVTPSLLTLPDSIDRPLFIGLIFIVGIGLPLLFFASILFGVAWLIAATLGRQVQRMAVADLALQSRKRDAYWHLGKTAVLFTLGLEAGFLASGVFVPRSSQVFLLTLVWLVICISFIWLWLIATHVIAQMVLGSRTNMPGKSLTLTSGMSAFSLLLLLCALMPARAVFMVIDSAPSLEALVPPGVSSSDFFVVYIGGSGIVALLLGGMAFFVIIIMIVMVSIILFLVRKRTTWCQECGTEYTHLIVVGKTCRQCGADLAPWVFVERSQTIAAPQPVFVAAQPPSHVEQSPAVAPTPAEQPPAPARPGDRARWILLLLIVASVGFCLFAVFAAASPFLVDVTLPDGSVAPTGMGVLSGLFCLIPGVLAALATVLIWKVFLRRSVPTDQSTIQTEGESKE